MPVPKARVALVSLLMIASTVVWRRGDLFTGGVDAVVAGKAVLSVAALLLAATAPGPRRRAGTGTLWFVVLLLLAGLLGALAHGTLVPSAVVAVRVVVLAATVFFLLRSAPAHEVLRGVVAACAAIGGVAAATALLPRLAALQLAPPQRLEGGVPPLNPNELAALAGLVVLWTVYRTAVGAGRPVHVAVGGSYLAVLWLTGSRTALLMVLAAAAMMLVQVRRPPRALVVAGLLAVGLGSLAAVATGAVGEFAARDGAGTSTLGVRLVAWRAALTWAQGPWQEAFGGGLAVKVIPVPGQYWDTQLLDSSWVSALVQSGLVGVLVAVLWVLWMLQGALRAPRPHRVLVLGLLVFLLGRSVLESGLFDATPMFLLLVAVSLLVDAPGRGRLAAEVVRPAGPVEVAAGQAERAGATAGADRSPMRRAAGAADRA